MHVSGLQLDEEARKAEKDRRDGVRHFVNLAAKKRKAQKKGAKR